MKLKLIAVYYTSESNMIKIHAVLDCRKNPNKTTEQLKQRRV